MSAPSFMTLLGLVLAVWAVVAVPVALLAGWWLHRVGRHMPGLPPSPDEAGQVPGARPATDDAAGAVSSPFDYGVS